MQRIGKLERWILINTYLKTIKDQLPIGWKYPRGINKYIDEIANNKCHPLNMHSRLQTLNLFKPVLTKSEILLNYFNLPVAYGEAFDKDRERFKDTEAYRKALVTLSRTLKRLEEKGLIVQGSWAYRAGTNLKLTDAGKLKAERLSKC